MVAIAPLFFFFLINKNLHYNSCCVGCKMLLHFNLKKVFIPCWGKLTVYMLASKKKGKYFKGSFNALKGSWQKFLETIFPTIAQPQQQLNDSFAGNCAVSLKPRAISEKIEQTLFWIISAKIKVFLWFRKDASYSKVYLLKQFCYSCKMVAISIFV